MQFVCTCYDSDVYRCMEVSWRVHMYGGVMVSINKGSLVINRRLTASVLASSAQRFHVSSSSQKVLLADWYLIMKQSFFETVIIKPRQRRQIKSARQVEQDSGRDAPDLLAFSLTAPASGRDNAHSSPPGRSGTSVTT